MSMRARTIVFVSVILIVNCGSVFAATTPGAPASSADRLPESKCTATNDRSALPGCGCFSAGYVPFFCPPGANGESLSGNSSGDQKISRETEAILQVSERTLREVEEHTNFLEALWKWTTIVSSMVAAGIAVLGIKSIRDLSAAKDRALKVAERADQAANRANDAVKTMEARFDKLSKEMSSNFFVMMGCLSVQGTLDAIASNQARPDDAARGNAAFEEKRETDTYRGVLNVLAPLLEKHDPQDRGVAAYAYDILGFAQFKTGNVSAALESARKSIAFSPKNGTALYNAACYAAKLHLIDTSVGFLERAIEEDQHHLASAKSDPDFDSIRGSAEFTRLVGA
jgi:tetratricopeptide (TPR) repeat protein